MRTEKLGKLVEITIGRTPSRSNSGLWDKEKETDNVWLSIADLLHAKKREVFDSKEYISNEAAKTFAVVSKGTLLVSFKLTLGRLAFTGKDLRTNEAIAALHNDEKKVLNEYLYHYLSKFNWQKYASADRKVKGLTLNKEKLGQIPVEYPESLDEQRKIVERLDKALSRITRAEELLRRNIINVTDLQKSILDEAFRFDGDTHTHRLGDVLTLQRGFDLPKQSRTAGKYPLISSSGSIDCISEHKVKGAGVCTGRSGSIGNVFYEEKDFWPLNTTLYIKDFHGNNPKYCYWLLKSFDLTQFTGGTGVPTLNRNVVHEYRVAIHDKGEQENIAKQIDEKMQKASSVKLLYDKKVAKLAELKSSMLAEAFMVK